ncbi:MAG: guanylate kinase [Candidatus Dadabacteria bacterium]|nr:MAG: guanylate kinase [Candidatus Dadabacteria bacterium]
MQHRPFLVIISAPSGTGKTTVCHGVLRRLEHIRFSISHTTRPIRPGEVDGRDYHFVDRPTFERLRDEGAFLEWADVYGNLYGTSVAEIERAASENTDLLVEIDVQGALQIMDKDVDAVSVFVLPPSLDTIEQRLRARDTDREDEIERRLAEARSELAKAGSYDYWVVNDDLEQAIADVACIVRAERRRRTRQRIAGHPLERLLGEGTH